MTDRYSTGRRLGPGPLLLLLSLFAILWFGTLDYRQLINPDEARYAEIAREMVASGDWVTPRLNGLKYFEKPALQYWATATAFTLFGANEWTARLWSALCGFLGICATALAVRRLWGGSAAFHAGGVLAGSLLWVMTGHINTLDMGVSFFLAAAIFCFVLAQHDEATPRENRNFMWLGWLALGLATLSKGLIGLVLPAATLVAYSLWQRDFAIWRRLHLLTGLALLLAVTAPWFIAVSLDNPEFARFFFIHEHFERFLTKVHDRYQPAWYFIPILLAGMLPWLVSMFSMLGGALRRDASSHFQPKRFLLLWCVVVFGFFSASSSKLPTYILPLFPALAALIGAHFAELGRRNPTTLRWHALPIVLLAVACGLGAPLLLRQGGDPARAELYAAYLPWLRVASLLLFGGALAAYFLARRGRGHAATLGLAAGGFLFAQLVLLGHNSFAPTNSSAQIAARISDQVRPDAPFFSVYQYDQGLPFYLGRTLTVVAFQGELAFGMQQEPRKAIAEIAAFEQAWRAAPDAWAVFEPDAFGHFEKAGLPMRVIARDPRRVVVRKP